MPRKPKAPATKGVAWDPDIYDILEFVRGIKDLRPTPESIIPPALMERLAGLARAADNETFQAGITFCVQAACKDFPLLSSSVYRTELVGRIEKVEEAASCLRDELQAIANPADRTALWAARTISAELNTKPRETGEWESKGAPDRLNPLAPYLRELSVLIDAIGKAKTSTSQPYVIFAQKKGAPAGAGRSGMALTKFVGHLKFAALAAGGRWTLNKNDQSGTQSQTRRIGQRSGPQGQ